LVFVFAVDFILVLVFALDFALNFVFVCSTHTGSGNLLSEFAMAIEDSGKTPKIGG
jgi:hypothetical protein